MAPLAENPLLAEVESARLDAEISVVTYVKALDDGSTAGVVELLRLDVVSSGRRLNAASKAWRAERDLQGALQRTLS